jgi:hypothetical protein
VTGVKKEFDNRMEAAGFKKKTRKDAVYYTRKENEPVKRTTGVALLLTGFTLGIVIVAAVVGLILVLNG